MTTLKTRKAKLLTLGDLLERLGGISPERVRLNPPPGKATERDVIRIRDREKRACELIEGTLVEKAMGIKESFLAMFLGHLLLDFLAAKDLGFVTGADGAYRLWPGLIRVPDIAFVSWSKLPKREVPDEPIPDLVPDLAVEVLSEGNTPKEMTKKLADYFRYGIACFWFVDLKKRSVEVFSSPTQSIVLSEGDTLDGSPILPGLRIPLKTLFAGRSAPKSNRKPRKRK